MTHAGRRQQQSCQHIVAAVAQPRLSGARVVGGEGQGVAEAVVHVCLGRKV